MAQAQRQSYPPAAKREHAQFAYRWSAWLDDAKQASFGQNASSLPASALAADFK
jgi:hypothetical protein